MMLKKSKGITWPLAFLALATTIVYMAGLASLQHNCDELTGLSQARIVGRSAFGISDMFQCHRMLRFYWFIFAFVMATILGLLITSFIKTGLHFSRPFWVGMITISIVLMMIASEFFLGSDNGMTGFWGSSWAHNSWRAATAGAIMSVVSLVLLLMAVGTDWDRFGHGSHHGHGDKATGHHTTGQHTTTTQNVAVPVDNVRIVDRV